ncbi:hypothetical protein ACOKM3_02020 [Streptomyces sp. BH106]|uniref:hypothetical protein n=1 Tax=Streptomyces sp. BH106 TaxID=3410409 RepID=UPI003CE82342
MKHHRTMLASAVAIGAVISGAAPSAAASTAPAAVNCTGTSTVTYSPAITSEPRTVTSTSSQSWKTCAVINGGGITKARDSVTRTSLTRSCATLLNTTPKQQQTVSWDNGQTSTAAVTTTQVESALVVTSIGKITSGPFVGENYKRVSTYANVDALTACSSPGGLAKLGPGVSDLAITPLV